MLDLTDLSDGYLQDRVAAATSSVADIIGIHFVLHLPHSLVICVFCVRRHFLSLS